MESGLLSLKAELLKKKSEAQSSKDVTIAHVQRPFPKFLQKVQESSPKVKKTEVTTVQRVFDDEENKKLEKSRSVLVQKAALYDRLKRGELELQEDMDERLLVDFKAKVYGYSQREEETIDLPENESSFREEKIKADMHQRWDKMEEETRAKKDVHYADVLFDEARSHGAGFMKFSTDENERLEQQRQLREIGEKNKQAEKSLADDRTKRKQLLSQRLAKVRQRKRLKLGLPIRDELEDSAIVQSEEKTECQSQVEVVTTEQSETIAIEKPVNPKPTTIREWDIGKPGTGSFLSQWVKPKPAGSSPMSQESWNKARRSERKAEFAPPTLNGSCSANGSRSVSQNSKSKNISNPVSGNSDSKSKLSYTCKGLSNTSQPHSSNKGAQIPPPASFEYYGPQKGWSKSSLKTNSMEDSISKGIAALRDVDGS